MRISFPFTNLLAMPLCLTHTTTDKLSLTNLQHCKEQMILKKQKSRFCRYISYIEIFQHLLFSIAPKHNNGSWLTLSNVSLQRKNEGTT